MNPPLVNALHPPGEFQVYDIVFFDVRFTRTKASAGSRRLPVTVFMNGVLVQDHHPETRGSGGHMRARTKTRPVSPTQGSSPRLQDHGNPTRSRNIWVRRISEEAA